MFANPLQLAHHYWAQLLTPKDRAIDATAGNGHDTRLLSQLAGQVYAWDIQEIAQQKVEGLDNVTFCLGCHSELPQELEKPCKLAVYNLGYLPGGNKEITTRVETTLLSVERVSVLLGRGGALSITCYPGHAEGAREEEALLSWSTALPQHEWCVVHHRFANRRTSPSLLWIQKILPQGSSCRRG